MDSISKLGISLSGHVLYKLYDDRQKLARRNYE